MAKVSGKIGYYSNTESEPGVWEDTITEKQYYGDVVRNFNKLTSIDSINTKLTLRNNISIVADPYAFHNFQHIKYIEIDGVKWTVTGVEVQHPRLILELGEVYNG